MNNCRLEKIHVTDNDHPYSNDLLRRDHCGETLLKLVESFSDGFVMAINGKWGSGKTTFVEMWQQQMKNAGYQTIYYNVWEMDHIEDPLIGIIAEFKKMTTPKDMKRLEKFTNVVRKVSFSMIPTLLALMVKHFTGLNIEDLDKVVKEASDEAMDILNDYVDNYIKQQESIKEFKTALIDYVNDISSNKPLIFIIDELDRCKPDFAVKTLERVKHLFSVENVVFVLAIDRIQLGHSIRGFYGSDLIDADDYLRRFIDVQYDLPLGTVGDLVDKIFKRFDFSKSFVKTEESDQMLYRLQNTVSSLYDYNKLSIRQLEKWILQTRLVFNQLITKGLSPETIVFLVYLYNFDSAFYNNLIIDNLSDQEIFDHLVQSFSHETMEVGYHINLEYGVIAEVFKMMYYKKPFLFQERLFSSQEEFKLAIDKKYVEKDILREEFNRIMNEDLPSFKVINAYLCEYNSIDF